MHRSFEGVHGDALTLPRLMPWVPPSPALRYGVHGFFLLRERSRDSWIAISGSGWRSMGDFEGSFGDKRRSVVLARLEQAMVAQSSVIVRRLGEDRAGEISAHRVLAGEGGERSEAGEGL